MKGSSSFALCAMLCVVAVVLLSEAGVSQAVTCSPSQLSACQAAITTSAPPSSGCCSKLKEQKPCLCGYLKNPNFKKYVSAAAAKKLATKCGVSFPSC